MVGSNGVTYRDAGVDIDAGNEVVRRIGQWVKATHSRQVLSESHGSFGGFFRLFGGAVDQKEYRDPVLVAATDGVGTKLKIAFLMGRHDTVGVDLVAMCVNDLIVGGARPLFFLDYVATAHVDPDQLEQVVKGIAEGCMQADCALLGGETAELPGFYKKGEFDLAGFSVGVVDRTRIIDGSKVRCGDSIIGIASSGLHSNGFSLVRKVLVDGKGKRALKVHHDDLGRTLGEELLEPTRIYVKPIVSLLGKYRRRRPIRAIAHITGGGLVENVPRVLPVGCDAVIQRAAWEVPPIYAILKKEGSIRRPEMDRVFNMGIGLVLVVDPTHTDSVLAHLEASGETATVIGEIVAGKGKGKVRYSRSRSSKA